MPKLNLWRSKSFFFWLLPLCSLIYLLAVFQDFVFSRLRNTGFYWSDTLLYNTYWLLFIPFVWLLYQGVRQFAKQKIIAFSLLSTLAMLLVSSMHILLFVSVFIFFSHLFFNTPHRFQPILSTVLSNQLYLTILVYWMLPFIWSYFEKNKQKPLDIAPKATVLNLKVGKITVKVPVSTIQVICTDRPYTALHTTEHKYLSSQSLKALEKELNENLFLRVHRSAIINKNEVQELQSRQNGDYDAILKNGQTVRLSRHYRQSWGVLLKD